MKALRGLVTLFAAVFVAVVGDAAEIELRVTGNRVNLRAAADPEAEIVGQVSSGDILYTRALDGKWVAVLPPTDIDLWVYGELVRDDTVAVPTLKVRSGPGITYRPVGILDKGARLTVRGERNGWLRIKPPSDCVLWISRQYVKENAPPEPTPPAPSPAPSTPPSASPRVSRAPAPAPAPRPRPDPRPVPRQFRSPSANVGTAPTAPTPRETPAPVRVVPLDKDRLVDSKPQGEKVRLRGTLRRVGWVWRSPTSYRLVRHDEMGRAVTVCYVLGDEQELVRHLGSHVELRGKAYWVQGVRYRVVVVE